jgi:serine protease Do
VPKKLIATIVFSCAILCGWVYCSQPKEYTLQQLYKEKANCVIEIISKDTKESRTMHTGAGFFVSETGLVATAAHVIYREPAGISQAITAFLDKRPTTLYTVEVKKIDLQHDIAILKIVRPALLKEGGTLPVFKYLELNIDDDSLMAGDRLITIGNPSAFFRIMSEGIISNTYTQNVTLDNDLLKYKDLVITTLLVYPGNSGGPVFNTYGQVVGVLTLGNEAEKLALFQKAKYVERLLEDTSDKVIIYEKESK